MIIKLESIENKQRKGINLFLSYKHNNLEREAIIYLSEIDMTIGNVILNINEMLKNLSKDIEDKLLKNNK